MGLTRKVPAFLKKQQHTWTVSFDMEKMSPIVCYYMRLLVVQECMKVFKDDASGESKTFLLQTMDHLEQLKASMTASSIDYSEVEGVAKCVENGCKLLKKAEDLDRAQQYMQHGKMMVKLYFTAGIIFDALKVFENYDDSLAQQAKFAKWRSTHIHTSLQKGEMPTPPKPREGEADDAALMAELDAMGPSSHAQPAAPTPSVQPSYQPPLTPAYQQPAQPAYQQPAASSSSSGGTRNHGDIQQAKKMIQTALQCLNYQDVEGTILELEDCIKFLKTGSK